MRNFKPGDKVKCIKELYDKDTWDYPQLGRVFTVLHCVNGKMSFKEYKNSDKLEAWTTDRFELVKEDKQNTEWGF